MDFDMYKNPVTKFGLSMMMFGVQYPEEIKIITQSKEVDVHALIGNIGGYIGLFLGNLLQYITYHFDGQYTYLRISIMPNQKLE